MERGVHPARFHAIVLSTGHAFRYAVYRKEAP
jgi:hypothetical protein